MLLARVLVPDDGVEVGFLGGEQVEVAVGVEVQHFDEIVLGAAGAGDVVARPVGLRRGSVVGEPEDAGTVAVGAFTGQQQIVSAVEVDVGNGDRLGAAGGVGEGNGVGLPVPSGFIGAAEPQERARLHGDDDV